MPIAIISKLCYLDFKFHFRLEALCAITQFTGKKTLTYLCLKGRNNIELVLFVEASGP